MPNLIKKSWTVSTHYVSINTVLNLSKNWHFLNPPTQSYAYVIYEWSLSNRFSSVRGESDSDFRQAQRLWVSDLVLSSALQKYM